MSNILLLTNKIDHSPSGGRELLCKLNHDILKEIYKNQCTVFELSKISISGLIGVSNAFRGYIDGLTPETTANALHLIQRQNIDKIFVDGSNLGGFVKVVKKRFPQIGLSFKHHK